MTELRLGLDVANTHAEGVVLDEHDRVLVRARTEKGGDGESSLRTVLGNLVEDHRLDPSRITRAVLGSAVAADAIERCRGLRRVAVLRVGAPLTLAVPPLGTWPLRLRHSASAGEAVVGGGAEYDGRSVSPLDGDAVSRFLATVAGAAEGVAVTSVFSSAAPDHELQAAEIVRRELGASMEVSLSHEIGTTGLLERENATVLSAALLGVVERLLASFGEMLAERDIDAELFLAQGDGTVMTPEHALRFPAYLLGSGPASAIRGGAWLSDVMDGVSLEIGRTGATVGAVVNGRPHERATPNELAGVRANFRLPELLTLPSVGGANGQTRIATALNGAWRAQPRPTLFVVGGGAAAAAARYEGFGETIVPRDGDVARAIGLVIAPAAGHADRVCANRPAARQTTIEAARADAIARAIHAGADPARVQIVEVDEIPLTYLLDPPIRISVRASGPRI
jgi:N-methylhydantoinase A/oxoprolinase/acetone carboxylase beta subunit